MAAIPYWAWLVAGLLLLIVEMVTTTFFVAFFGIGLMIGQDPAWVGPAWAIAAGLWGGSAAAFMTNNKKS
jgi:membrane protein implicated in regulation of membrane protease activity